MTGMSRFVMGLSTTPKEPQRPVPLPTTSTKSSRRRRSLSARTNRFIPHAGPLGNGRVDEVALSRLREALRGGDLGLRPQVSSYLLTDTSPLASGEIQGARDVAAKHVGVFVNSDEDYLPPYALTRAAVTAASLPLALSIVAVAVALVASESRRSRQILVAVGAEPMSHRKLLGATSALMALIAAVLAVPAGLVPMIVLWATASQSNLPFVIPWATIAIILFVVPSVAALVSGAVARTPKPGSLLSPAT